MKQKISSTPLGLSIDCEKVAPYRYYIANIDVLIAARCGYDLSNHYHALADAEACAAIALEIL